MARLTREQKEAVRVELAGLAGPALAARAERFARDLGVHVSTVYRATEGYRPSRRRRADSGRARKPIPEGAFGLISGIVGLGGSVTRGVELARLNSLMNGDAPGLGAIRSQLRERGLSARWVKGARELTPRRRFEAKAPNLLHQVDHTVAPQFYIDGDGSVGFEGPLRLSKNHPGNRRPRLWISALIDDHSRAGYARFYACQPNAWSVPDFLFRAWAEKGRDFVFHGMPRLLYTDRDPAHTSKTFLRAMEILGVKTIYHMPGEPQAKGKVERFLRTLLADQVVTRIAKFKSLDEANEYLEELLRFYNSRRHGTTGEIPFHRWRSIRAEDLRLLPREELREILLLKRLVRRVPADLRLSVEGVLVQLPYRPPWVNLIGSRVEVLVGPSMTESVLVADAEGETHEIALSRPIRHEAGQFKGIVKTRRQEALSEAQARDLSGVRLWGFGEGEGSRAGELPEILPVRGGEAFDESAVAGQPGAPRSFDLLDAISALQREGLIGRPISEAERLWIEGQFAGRERLEASEMAEVAARLEKAGGAAEETG